MASQVKLYGPLVPGWWLTKTIIDNFHIANSQWGLASHSDGPFFEETMFTWPDDAIPPRPRPRQDAGRAEHFSFECAVQKINNALVGRPVACWHLVNGCVKAGFRPDQVFFGEWLTDRIGRLIEQNPDGDFDKAHSIYMRLKGEAW